MIPKNQSKINSMQDVYDILNVVPDDTYEVITLKYNRLLDEYSNLDLTDVNKAYKLVGVIYGEVEHSGFNKWYEDVTYELSLISPEFKLYEGNVERISIIDYMEPEIFFDAYLKAYTPIQFSKDFHNNVETRSLIEEANIHKKTIEASLSRINSANSSLKCNT